MQQSIKTRTATNNEENITMKTVNELQILQSMRTEGFWYQIIL